MFGLRVCILRIVFFYWGFVSHATSTLIEAILLYLCGACVLYFNTVWTLSKFERYAKTLSVANNSSLRGSTFMLHGSMRMRNSRQSLGSVCGKHLFIWQVMNCKEGFEAFMDMMRVQQCLENALFLLEFCPL